MGTGYYGGFGKTYGSRAVSASPTYVGKGEGDSLAKFAKAIKPESGYTDIVIHGTQERVAIMHNGKWEYLDQRRLATLMKRDRDLWKGKSIRLISCSTGADTAGFAQNLANKLGVKVKAPSDTLWVWPNGKMTIGPSQFKNTGHWVIYKPYRKGEK